MGKRNLNDEVLSNTIYCPLYKKEIDCNICFDISMVADKLAPERTIPDEIKEMDEYSDICIKCKHHDV